MFGISGICEQCAVSPEPLQITLKRRDLDEGLGQIS